MLQEPAAADTPHHSLPELAMSQGEGTCTATLRGGAVQGICSTRSSPGHGHDAAGWERPFQGTRPSPLP